MDGIKSTYFHALLTTDTGRLTCFHGNSTLVLVHTTNDYAHFLLAFYLTYFDDMTRTGFGTRTAGGTFLAVNFWKTCLRVHFDSVKLTFRYAVSTAKTTIGTAGLAHARRIHHFTAANTIKLHQTGTVGTTAVTSHDCQLRRARLYLHAKYRSYFLHGWLTTYRTV